MLEAVHRVEDALEALSVGRRPRYVPIGEEDSTVTEDEQTRDGAPAPKFLMTYRAVEGFMPLAQEHGPAHVARLHEFRERGLALMAGPLGEPFDGDAVGVFTTREAAAEFIAGDPIVLHGVVASWTVRPWSEVLA